MAVDGPNIASPEQLPFVVDEAAVDILLEGTHNRGERSDFERYEQHRLQLLALAFSTTTWSNRR
jgi:hypothetical protein